MDHLEPEKEGEGNRGNDTRGDDKSLGVQRPVPSIENGNVARQEPVGCGHRSRGGMKP